MFYHLAASSYSKVVNYTKNSHKINNKKPNGAGKAVAIDSFFVLMIGHKKRANKFCELSLVISAIPGCIC
jgi:hypothetical protein